MPYADPEVRKAYMKAYREKNKEVLKEKIKDYRKSYNAYYYSANKEAQRVRSKQWKDQNKEIVKATSLAYRINNKEKVKQSMKKWMQENQDKVIANIAKRRTAKMKRSPKWLTDEQMRQIEYIYLEAKMLEVETGIKHHVDHIIPLQGKNVSGLHVPENLRVISAEENLRKCNRYEC
jgi:hypothetical protein